MRIFIRTSKTGEIQHYINTYSICSVARPRPTRVCKTPTAELFQSTRSQDRDKVVICVHLCDVDISIHSVARPRHSNQFSGAESGYFNPLGRKTETIPHKQQQNNRNISIHSVARPRQRNIRRSHKRRIFQSTRSQDRDQYWNIRYNASIYFNPLGLKTETAKLNNY